MQLTWSEGFKLGHLEPDDILMFGGETRERPLIPRVADSALSPLVALEENDGILICSGTRS
jgi:hypothetical protein